MNKSVRNVASVNGPSQQEIINSLELDLELAKQVAKQNFEIAEELGGALEIAEGKIATLQARVEELERENSLQVEVIAGKEANITKNKKKKTVNEEVSV